MNIGRSHSIRSKRSENTSSSSSKPHFSLASLRGHQQPELSKKLYKLIKSENHAINAYEQASKEGASIAGQLSEWGESTNDEALSDVSDKLGVLLAEIAEQEDLFAQGLEDSRSVLKQIRNTESSVQPSRTHKQKIQDEIQKLKYKEPESTKLITLEQELVRAEAQSLVAKPSSPTSPARSSKKPTTSTPRPSSSAPRSKSCSRLKPASSSTCSTTRPSCPARSAQRTPTLRLRGKRSTTPKRV